MLTHASWNDVPVAYGEGETPFGSTLVTIVEPKSGERGGFVTMPDPKSGKLETYGLLKPLKSG
jgi:hypothetical protein